MSGNGKEYFWACTLSSASPICSWPSEDDKSDACPECLFLRMATLGKAAKCGERNLIEVETRDSNNAEVRVPLFSLREGISETVKLNMTFDEPVKFHLVAGSGPVSISAKSLCSRKSADDSYEQSESDVESPPGILRRYWNADARDCSRKRADGAKKRRNGRLRLADYVESEAEEDNRAFPSETDGEMEDSQAEEADSHGAKRSEDERLESESDLEWRGAVQRYARGKTIRARLIDSDSNTEDELPTVATEVKCNGVAAAVSDSSEIVSNGVTNGPSGESANEPRAADSNRSSRRSRKRKLDLDS